MYRVMHQGLVIECETAGDVAALVLVFGAPPAALQRIAEVNKKYDLASVRATRKKGPQRVVAPQNEDSSDASVRRGQLFDAIKRSEVGLTLAELRKATPKMDGKDRSNALQQLKARGEIRRAGNSWIKAA